MDKAQKWIVFAAVITSAVVFAACVGASSSVSSTPLYTLRMEQASNNMHFLPTAVSEFTYNTEKGHTIAYTVSAKPQKYNIQGYTEFGSTCATCWLTCYTCGIGCDTSDGTCWFTCQPTCDDMYTCEKTCDDYTHYTCETCYLTCKCTCARTCEGNTCEETCEPTCEGPTCTPTCWETCNTCTHTWQGSCGASCEFTCEPTCGGSTCADETCWYTCWDTCDTCMITC